MHTASNGAQVLDSVCTLCSLGLRSLEELLDRTVSELFSSGETNDTVGALPTGFKPVEKKEKRKSSLFPLWT